MQQLINFLIRSKHFLLFLLLLCVAILFTAQSRSYHRSKFVNSANFISGGVYENMANISEYFSLKEENEKLQLENSKLRKMLVNTAIEKREEHIVNENKYTVFPAKIINNNYSSRNNYLTINKGSKQGIEEDYGVISSQGIVGIVRSTSKNYATVLSVLNATDVKINAKIKNTSHFATLIWDGKYPNILQLINLPKLAPIKKGDTIETNGYSNIFPEGIPIGTIKNFTLNKQNNYYDVDVKLFNDMTSLKHVYVIKVNDKKEIETLEQAISE